MGIQLPRRRYLLWLLSAVVLAASLVVGLSVGITPVHSQPAQLPSPTAAYSIFDRAAVATDTPTTDLNEGAYVSRQIATGDPLLRQWITVSGDTLCVQIETEEGGEAVGPRACNAAVNLEGNELLVLGLGGAPAVVPSLTGQSSESIGEATRPGPPRLLVGLAPDGVSQVSIAFAGGHLQTVNTGDNGFHVYIGGSAPTALTWTTADGVRHSQTL